MKLIEAINQIDTLKNNSYSQQDKIGWLDRLDRMIKLQILDTHEGAAGADFAGYDEHTDPQTALLVPAPYDEVYLRWLEAQIHYHNEEMDKYNAAITMYNTAYDGFARYYNRTHMPKSGGNRFLF